MSESSRGRAPGGDAWLAAETTRLLEFAEGSWSPLGGFARQDDRGMRVPGAPAELWLTGRMTHVFCLGTLLGHPGAEELVGHGLAALTGRFHDAEYGGWYPEVGAGGPVRAEKEFYQHAFVVLAAASAVIVGFEAAADLLEQALRLIDRRFWARDEGMVVESWDRRFTQAEPYRGVNAVMHGVEAFLAAFDASGDESWREYALRMAERVVRGFAEPRDWRIPEHFDADWRPLPDYHRDRPDDPFRPYGSTCGHGLEWARLCLALRAAFGVDAPDWLLGAARALFDRAVADGWAVDGAEGFVYTVDWDGTPVVHQRMHWVLAEGLGAAAALRAVTGESSYREWLDRWWAYAERYLIDRELGSWHHELDRHNRPAATVWKGKPDAYHAVQATLVPRIPVGVSVAGALSDALSD
jgi:mannose/cellobiose epimerase-like protein (N-acyl-D-glucosamine 2-epimerase family)